MFETIAERPIQNEVTPVMQRSLPPYNHIKLNFLRLEEVIIFMDQIYQYELEHRIRLPIHSLLAVSVREIIVAEIGQSVTEQRFYSIPREEVFAAIREHVKPRSKPAFAQALKRKIDLDWPNNFELSPTNFKVAYERYLIYRNKFMKRYDFMRENKSQNIPECRDNDDGLIGIFLKGLNNFSYPKTAYGRIPHDTKKTFRGEDGFQTFIDVYCTHIKDDYEKYKSARELTREHEA